MILHKSGEYMSETLSMPVGKNDAHGIGSAITYARRYGMSALLNLAADDDDGNAAVAKPTVDPNVVKVIAVAAKAEAEKGLDALTTFWKSLPEDQRKMLTPESLKDLKDIATKADNAKKETE